MLSSNRVLRLAGVATALFIALLLAQTLAASEDAPPGLRTLHPGDNLIGWVGYPTTAQELFEQIPEAGWISTWDAQLSRYRFAVRGLKVGLREIEPGMGLLVRIRGEDPVDWIQPTAADGEFLPLRRGPNLVAWTGPSGTPIDLAVRSIGESFNQALYWIPETKKFGAFNPDSETPSTNQPTLRRGDALWVFNETESNWLQPSGDRALHPLGPPPDHIRWHDSFDKYLDADGIAVLSSDSVADEALFRAAAILDDMLVNRPDIREALVREQVHVVIVGSSEETFDLAPFGQFRDVEEYEPSSSGGPRGFGPTQDTPTLVSEENLLCNNGDSDLGPDNAVYLYALMIDYALTNDSFGGVFESSMAAAYRSVRDSDFWDGPYGPRNDTTFWAAGVQAWLGLAVSTYGTLNNQLELNRYATEIADLVVDTLGELELGSTCHEANARTQGAARKLVVSGHLIDQDEVPLSNASVNLRNASGDYASYFTYSRPDGDYYIFAPPGEYWLWLSRDGCLVNYSNAGPTADRDARSVVSIVDQDLHIDFRFDQDLCEYGVKGRVVDADGKPLQYAFFWANSEGRFYYAITGADGRFKLRIPHAGAYHLTVSVGKCNYTFDGIDTLWPSGHVLPVDVTQVGITEVEIQVPDGEC